MILTLCFFIQNRSLQLSEKSPSRQSHKVVVKVGNSQPKEKPIYSQVRKPGYRSNNSDYARPSQIRLEIDGKKPRSFDIIDYRKPEYDQEFDKSKSFDDEYYNNDHYEQITFQNDQRSYSHDRVYAQIDYSSLPRRNMNYTNQVYDNEIAAYDVPKMRMSRSPIMGYGRNLSRERSPNPQLQRSSPYVQQQQDIYRRPSDMYRGRDPLYISPSSAGSDFENNGAEYDPNYESYLHQRNGPPNNGASSSIGRY